jgi:Zn finger protein HypA/HybF involved in hydrogenase expression
MSTNKKCEKFTNENIENPRLCKNGCGFYGSQNLDYYCSTCNKKINPVNMDVQKMEVEINIDNNNANNIIINSDNSVLNENTILVVNDKKINSKKRKRTRCNMCRKRLALHTTFVCPDCKTVTCSIHRYHEEHNCPKLDEMLERKNKQLKRSLPTIIAKKIERI